MTEALRVFDQVTETAMPDESYWPGYETRLRERLRPERRSWTRRLADWIGGFGLLTMRPLPVAVGLALVILAIGWWTWQRRQAERPSSAPPTSLRRPRLHSRSLNRTTNSLQKRQSRARSPKDESRIIRQPRGRMARRPPVRREERGGKVVEDVIVSRGSDQSLIAASLFTPETIRHFEKAQLMLRSFRNASAAKRLAATDLAYERQLSRRLLYQNILLRRDAEMKGNLPAEEALSSLEPFLIDIANLPDKPSSGELGGIRGTLAAQRADRCASDLFGAYVSNSVKRSECREGNQLCSTTFAIISRFADCFFERPGFIVGSGRGRPARA